MSIKLLQSVVGAGVVGGVAQIDGQAQDELVNAGLFRPTQ